MENKKTPAEEPSKATDESTGTKEQDETLTTEPTETTTEEPEPILTHEEMKRLVNEAEERGYLRGRNEAVDVLMERPDHEAARMPEIQDEEDPVMILRQMRRSVWD